MNRLRSSHATVSATASLRTFGTKRSRASSAGQGQVQREFDQHHPQPTHFKNDAISLLFSAIVQLALKPHANSPEGLKRSL